MMPGGDSRRLRDHGGGRLFAAGNTDESRTWMSGVLHTSTRGWTTDCLSLERGGAWSCSEASSCCPFDPVADVRIVVDDQACGHGTQGHVAQKRSTQDFTWNVQFTEKTRNKLHDTM